MKVVFDVLAGRLAIEGDGPELIKVLEVARELAPAISQIQIVTSKPVQDRVAVKGRVYGNEEKLRWYVRNNLEMKAGYIGGFYDNVFSVLRNRGKMVVTPESVVEMTRMIEECRKQNPEFIL